MFHLTESQITAIESLANFKYLTSSQFVKMGLFKKRDYLTKSLKKLLDVNNPLIAKYDFNPVNGKLESFYYLTKYGKMFLQNEFEYSLDQIKAPRGYKTMQLKDYFHRRFTISFHIYLRQWLDNKNGEMLFLDYYFDKSGNNRSSIKNEHVTALNRIKLKDTNSFIPDINTMFSIDNKEYLYLFEQHNGKDSKRLFEQLYIHIIAISQGVVSDKYNFKKSHKVIVVCEFESVKKSVMNRLQKEVGIESYNNLFLFKTNEELDEDFYNNWSCIDGTKVNFIGK